jgi:hypothetical protein
MTTYVIRKRDASVNAKVIVKRSEAKAKQQAALAQLLELRYQFGWNDLREKHIDTLRKALLK